MNFFYEIIPYSERLHKRTQEISHGTSNTADKNAREDF